MTKTEKTGMINRGSSRKILGPQAEKEGSACVTLFGKMPLQKIIKPFSGDF